MFKTNDLLKVNNYWNSKSIEKKIKILINLNSNKKTISKNLIKITNKYPKNMLYKYYFNLLFEDQIGGSKEIDKKLYGEMKDEINKKVDLIKSLLNESELTSRNIQDKFNTLNSEKQALDSEKVEFEKQINSLENEYRDLETEKQLIKATKKSLENFQNNFTRYLNDKLSKLLKINRTIANKTKVKIKSFNSITGDPELKIKNALPLPLGWKVAFNKKNKLYYYYDSNNQFCKEGKSSAQGCEEYYDRPIPNNRGKHLKGWFSKKNNNKFIHYNKVLDLETENNPATEPIIIGGKESGWYAKYSDKKIFYNNDKLDIISELDPREGIQLK